MCTQDENKATPNDYYDDVCQSSQPDLQYVIHPAEQMKFYLMHWFAFLGLT